MGPARASTSQAPAADQEAAAPLAHGGSLREARVLFPHAPEPWIDLSTGINPVAYPVPPLPADAFTRLPEPEALAELEACAARAYGVADPSFVVAAPGTQILISALPRLFPLRAVAVLGPTYGEHAAAWAQAGAAVTETSDFGALAAADGAVLCNPNNPDGRRLAPERLVALARRMAARGGLLIVDEAFADLEPPPLSLAPSLPLPGAIVLRSFGKTYGLAGLRLGFALADAETAARIRAGLGPWAVSGAAIAIGRKALEDEAWFGDTAERLAANAKRLDALLESVGATVIGGTSLFRLAETPRAAELFDKLGRAGIYVRRFGTQPHRLRFGLPADGAQWRRLEAALA